jgi:hypothetical protein
MLLVQKVYREIAYACRLLRARKRIGFILSTVLIIKAKSLRRKPVYQRHL